MKNIILISGASSDIGIDLINSITEDCIIIGHYHTNNSNLLNVQKTSKNKIIPIQADFSSEKSIETMLDFIESEIGIPNKIIHLASPKFKNIRFKNTNWNSFQNELNISVGSILIILNRFLPKLAKEKTGKVISMLSSVTIGVPPKALSQYTTAKYALLGLMKSLSSEYAEKGISINCISPSMVKTQFLSLINERVIELTAEAHPLKRIATTHDIIPVILMLMSDEVSYLNGANIPITGGETF